MQRKRRGIWLITTGVLLVIFTSFWMGSIQPVNAQCGSQASSCKNCHEVQGEYSVNNDGTAWHQSHSFGDFCYICHAGNNQATDKAEAHTGMVPPLSDVQASCQQCHFDDLDERAQVYADTLGVEIGVGSSENSASSGDSGGDSTHVSSGIGLMAPTELDINDPNVVDYVQRYNQIVLGEKPINKGNLVVGTLIGLVVLGGGSFVIHNEGWLGVDYEKVDEYPTEMVAFLPKISRLKPQAREKLKEILDDTKEADDTLLQLAERKDETK